MDKRINKIGAAARRCRPSGSGARIGVDARGANEDGGVTFGGDDYIEVGPVVRGATNGGGVDVAEQSLSPNGATAIARLVKS